MTKYLQITNYSEVGSSGLMRIPKVQDIVSNIKILNIRKFLEIVFLHFNPIEHFLQIFII